MCLVACENAPSHSRMRKYMQPSMHTTMHANACAAAWMDVYMNQAIVKYLVLGFLAFCHYFEFGSGSR